MSERIVFIGAGNVAWHLAPALEESGHQVVAVYSRTRKNAQQLTERLKDATPVDTLDFRDTQGTLFIFALSDASYRNVVTQTKAPQDTLWVHTSGSQPMEVLRKGENRVGVLYPLQTFSKTKPVKVSEVLFCLESDYPEDYTRLEKLVRTLGAPHRSMTSKQRTQVHLAAVFGCNFVNLVWQVTEKLLQEQNLEFQILEPLFRETLEKALLLNPTNAQTGPAIRGDQNILSKHQQMLEGNTHFLELYTLASQMIKEMEER